MGSKNTTNVHTIQTKQDIRAKAESGHTMTARHYGLNKSTVGTILTKKNAIQNTQVAKGGTKIPCEKQRCVVHGEIAFSLYKRKGNEKRYNQYGYHLRES